MPLATRFTDRFSIRHPLIQAPMAGVTTPELVAAVSNAGGLGSHGAGYLTPERIAEDIAAIRAQTDQPFNINLFVVRPAQADPAAIAHSLQLLAPLREELGLPPATVPERFAEPFAAQLDALIQARPPIASFTFGLLTAEEVQRLRAAGIAIIGTATTTAEARAWAELGADAICAQGSEAGGHRGTFLGDCESALIGTAALVPQLVDAVAVPVIASGGIMDGRGIAAALVLGATAVQLGTAFLTCDEALIPPGWKARLLAASDDGTVVTRAFSGRHARGLTNDFTRRFQPHQDRFPDYPVQNALTSEIRQAARKAERPEFLSLWAGQAAPLSRTLPAKALVETLMRETEAALAAPAGLRRN